MYALIRFGLREFIITARFNFNTTLVFPFLFLSIFNRISQNVHNV